MFTTLPKFSIGDKVSTKKTGFPGVGTIIGIMEAELYANISKMSLEEAVFRFRRWTETYPNWYTKLVIVVSFENPRRTVTLAEVLKAGGTEEDWENFPTAKVIAYPIDDLELFE